MGLLGADVLYIALANQALCKQPGAKGCIEGEQKQYVEIHFLFLLQFPKYYYVHCLQSPCT